MKTENSSGQVKILTGRCKNIDPGSIEDYIDNGGYEALRKALGMKPEELVEEVKKSGLRGRGGAGFPTGIKMESVLKTNEYPKYIVCNADEGEPGNFKDKYLLENDPHQLLEGIIIAAYAMGTGKGYIYIRGEYAESIKLITRAIEKAGAKGYIGKNIMGSGFDFELEIKSGAGAYICGEEFALIESIEGKPGRPKNKPPYPSLSGVYNKPTLINNVETISNLPFIINEGSGAFSSIGTQSSKGTRLVCLSGNVRKKGVYEVPFGISLWDIIYKLGEGVPEDRSIKLIQLGGASGPCITPGMLNMKIDYKEFEEEGIAMGSGAVIVVDERFDVLELMKRIMRFFRHESCGKCTPCREGIRQILRILYKIGAGSATENDLELLETLCNVMYETSFCGLGQAAPTAILTTLKYFREEYTRLIPGIREVV